MYCPRSVGTLWLGLVCFQFVSEQRHEESVQEPPCEDQQSAGYGAKRQEGSQHVEEQQQQYRPVAGQQAQAQPWLPLPLRRPLGRWALLQFCGGTRICQVVTTQAAQEVRT